MERKMADNTKQSFGINDVEQSVSPVTLFLIILAIIWGVVIGLWLIPNLIPGYAQSLSTEKPKVFWYLARSSAIISYLLLWFTMALGVGVTNKMTVRWPGLAKANELHQYFSILGIAFGLFHGLILLGDQYMNFSLWQIIVPFSTSSYRPLAVGLGQLAFYAWVVVLFSFYVRRKIGAKVWRGIHYASYFIYLSVLIHALLGGTDAGTPWLIWLYWITGGLVLFLTVYRTLYEIETAREKKKRLLERNQLLSSE
jgi:predicted ferric reductase